MAIDKISGIGNAKEWKFAKVPPKGLQGFYEADKAAVANNDLIKAIRRTDAGKNLRKIDIARFIEETKIPRNRTQEVKFFFKKLGTLVKQYGKQILRHIR